MPSRPAQRAPPVRPHRRGLGARPPAPRAPAASDERQAPIVDIGGGTGGFAVPLAELGHRVQVIDPSPDALAALDRRAREAASPTGSPASRATSSTCSTWSPPAAPTWCSATACSRSSTTPPPPWPRSPAVLRPGGTLSLLVAQRHAAVVARAMAGHFQARPGPARRRPSTLAPGRGGRRFTHDEVTALLADAGFAPASVHGVRVFADLVPGSLLDLEPGATAALVELEQAVADRPEYLPLATQLHAARAPLSRCRRGDRGPARRRDRDPGVPDPARRHGRLLRLRGDPRPPRPRRTSR